MFEVYDTMAVLGMICEPNIASLGGHVLRSAFVIDGLTDSFVRKAVADLLALLPARTRLASELLGLPW